MTTAITVPQNIEAEEAVLGGILIDPEAFLNLDLLPEYFYLQKHRWIYTAMRDLQARGIPIDTLTLLDELERHGHLEAVGAVYINQLIGCVPTAIHCVYYADMVVTAYKKRRLLSLASNIAILAHDNEVPVSAAIDRATEELFDLAMPHGQHTEVAMPAAVDRYHTLLMERSQATTPTGITSGFIDLDQLLGGGLQRSDLIILAARPSMGKTAFMLSTALKSARQGKSIGIFSLEMSVEQLIQRMVAMLSGIDAQQLRLGKIAEDEWPRYTAAIGELAELPIFLDDTPALSLTQLRARARRMQHAHTLDLLMLDYLQLLSSDSRQENRTQEVSAFSRGLKALARELDVPLLSASQLSRATEQRADKRPVLSDLRESGSLEQDADVVAFIYRDEVYHPETAAPNIAEIIVAKQRNGPVGTINLFWRRNTTKFEDLARIT